MKPTHTYFQFGVVAKEGLAAYCDMMQEVGCEIVSISSGIIPAPQNRLAIHNGGKPQMMAVAEVYARCPAGEFEKVIERVKAREGQGLGTVKGSH
jgi:hypothetical protein